MQARGRFSLDGSSPFASGSGDDPLPNLKVGDILSFDWSNDGNIDHSTVVIDTDESNPRVWNTVVAFHSYDDVLKVDDIWKKHGQSQSITKIYVWHVNYNAQ